MKSVPTCPECNSTKTWKDGKRPTENGKVQRYYCRECCHRFSETSSNKTNEIKSFQAINRMPLNTPLNLLFDRQICASQATETKIVVTMNCRELLHFFEERCCMRAQWEIRRLAGRMLKICKRELPAIFSQAGSKCIRLGYCPEGKEFTCGRYPLKEKVVGYKATGSKITEP